MRWKVPYTISGLLDLSNLYLNGGVPLTGYSSPLYAAAIHNSITNVNAYAGTTASRLRPQVQVPPRCRRQSASERQAQQQGRVQPGTKPSKKRGDVQAGRNGRKPGGDI
ncbi:MAG: hypothetical protein IPM82_20510 [Saprospiraceae bacterium]|nr:hypothetical protein [Saprospiraceae bacterium]